MNFKSLLASALLGTSLLGGVAEAAPTTCAFRDSKGLDTFTCDHSTRRNANGHKVNDIVFFDGSKRHEFSIIWWMSGDVVDYAEVFTNGSRYVMSGYIAKNGAWCTSNNGTQFCVH